MSEVVAERDLSLGAQVVSRRPLRYAKGADLALDRPAHVRAGSALVRIGGGTFVVVQDDAAFLAVFESATGAIESLALHAPDGIRQFDDRRGNKKDKLDLEACATWHDVVYAFGSGSLPKRERVLIATPLTSGAPLRVVEVPALYAAMRANEAFAGSELNVEGAARDGDDIVFFQRGNGAARGDRVPCDATGRVDARALFAHLEGRAPCPPLRDVVTWNLGVEAGVRVTFTDAAARGKALAFLACAEASPDATRDGPVVGAFLGRIDDRTRSARLAPLRDELGKMLCDKTEGLVFDEENPKRAWVVVDKDDPDCASDLLELALDDGWLAG